MYSHLTNEELIALTNTMPQSELVSELLCRLERAMDALYELEDAE